MLPPRELLEQHKSLSDPRYNSQKRKQMSPGRPEFMTGRALNGLCPESITPCYRLLKTGCSGEELKRFLPRPSLPCAVPARSAAASLARLLLSQRCCIHSKCPPCSSYTRRSHVRRGRCRASQDRAGLDHVTVTFKQGRCKLATAAPLHTWQPWPDE